MLSLSSSLCTLQGYAGDDEVDYLCAINVFWLSFLMPTQTEMLSKGYFRFPLPLKVAEGRIFAWLHPQNRLTPSCWPGIGREPQAGQERESVMTSWHIGAQLPWASKLLER
eukprot:5177845-Amphidinium_carterae.1